MARIILIETSTALCSVALSIDGEIAAYREDSSRQHASLTAPFVRQVLQDRGLQVRDCDAVCVGMGPGSYTGLRVGVSTAKGLCFGAGIPLIAVNSLETLVWGVPRREEWKYIIPLIDARRMEVYTAVYTSSVQIVSPIEAKVIEPSSFARELSEGEVLFVGDGAAKCRPVVAGGVLPEQNFVQCCPSARDLAVPAQKAWHEKRFEDVAYFEPFYLKDFVATVPRKKLF